MSLASVDLTIDPDALHAFALACPAEPTTGAALGPNCGPWKLSGEEYAEVHPIWHNGTTGQAAWTTQRDENERHQPRAAAPHPFAPSSMPMAAPAQPTFVRIELYKADLTWDADAASRWRFGFRQRSHYHLFCSEKGNHARRPSPGSDRHEVSGLDQLPGPIRRIIEQTDTVLP